MNSYHVITICSHKALPIAPNIWRQDLDSIMLQPLWFLPDHDVVACGLPFTPHTYPPTH